MLWFSVCVCVCVNIISNRDAYWTVKFRVCTFLCFWSVCRDGYWSASRHVTVQGASSVKPALPKDARCLIRNKCSQTETQTHQRDFLCVCVGVCTCAYSSLCRGEGWGWQVLNCVEGERAAMGISRFMTLVRKLTNQSCFLFCSYNVNGAQSRPSCDHPQTY